MKEEWLFPNAVVPVDAETTAALVAEIHRLIDVVGGMALAQPAMRPATRKEKITRPGVYEVEAAQSAQEPVAEARYDGTLHWREPYGVGVHRIGGPLYTAPPAQPATPLLIAERDELRDLVRLQGIRIAELEKQGTPLTDAEIKEIYTGTNGLDFYLNFARAIEAKLKENT